VGSNFHNGCNYEIYLFFHTESLDFREVLFRIHSLLNTYCQQWNTYGGGGGDDDDDDCNKHSV